MVEMLILKQFGNLSDERIAEHWTRDRYYNAIDFDPGPPPMLVNRGKIQSHGIEWRFGWHPLETFALVGSLTYVDASVETSKEDLRGRPAWRGGLRVKWKALESLTVRLSLKSTSKIKDTSIPNGEVNLPGYLRVGATIENQLSARFFLLVALDNAHNRSYEEAVGFEARQRRLRLGIRTSASDQNFLQIFLSQALFLANLV